MKSIGFFIAFYLLTLSTRGQNLVSNPGFENYNSCPCAISDVDSSISNFPGVIGWCRPTDGTTDVFNSCCPFIYETSVPKNDFGYQNAHSGTGYGGFYAFFNTNQHPNDNYREYLQTKLLTSLKAGKNYCIEFYVSPTFNLLYGQQANSFEFATDDVGAWMTIDRPVHWTGGVMSNTNLLATPQIKTPDGFFLSDTALWYRIAGTYLAQGGEQWLTIGNFFSDANTSLQLISSDPNYYDDSTSYYYLDDVSVTEVSADNPFNDTTICNNSPFSKTLTALPGGSNYIWNTGDTTQSITVNAIGIYWVTADYGCGPVTDTIFINNQPLLSLTADSDVTKCDDGQPVFLSAIPGFNSYQWNTGDTTANLSVTQPGIYIVSATYACGTEYDTVSVIINPYPPPPTTSDDSLCLNQTTTALNAAGINLLWYPSFNSVAGSPVAPTPTTNAVGEQQYFVSQTVAGCESEKAMINVFVTSPPVTDLNGDSIICDGTSVNLQIDAPYSVILWNNGSTENHITATDSGWYKVSASNWCGNDEDSIHLRLSDCSACIIMPNAFTPNGDGLNDKFLPIIQCPPFSEYIFQIFNRWGEKVFQTTNQNEGWNGMNAGSSEPIGSYIFLVQYKIAETQASNSIDGNVTLIR